MWFYVLVTLCFIASCIYYCHRHNKVTPPSGMKEIPLERGLPVIGVLNKVGNSFSNYLVRLADKHGPIYRVRFGMRDVVVLNTFEYIKEALVQNGDAFTGKWNLLKYITVSNSSGIAFIDGHTWIQQRSFVLKTLKEFGMGKSISSEIVQEECMCLLEDLDKVCGETVDLSEFLPIYTANIICRFLMSKRFSHGDPDLTTIEKVTDTVLKDKSFITVFSLMFPIIDRMEWFMRFMVWVTRRKSLFHDYHGLIGSIMKDQLSRLDTNSEGKDLMDVFLITQHQMKEKFGYVDTFTDWQLVNNSLELLIGGYHTTTTTLVWAFMLMAMFPEIQDKVHKEITDVIGSERLPRINDKASLDYTQAVMDEVLRFSCIVPVPAHRRTLVDVCVKGHFIPKDSLVSMNLLACHLDPKIWAKPRDFYPEHFLSMGQNENLKYEPREELISFGLGKRQCLGESLARIELFVFFTTMLQRFRVSLAKKITCKLDFDDYSQNEGVIRLANFKDFRFQRWN